jgi:LPXTG-site transpeptidase (sortase) family protein
VRTLFFSILIILYSAVLFLLLLLFLPEIELPIYRYFSGVQADSTHSANYQTQQTKKQKTTNTDDTIMIPKIGVNAPIRRGAESTMNAGMWVRPASVDPDQHGNIIITGHRFKFLPPSSKTFYHLDKIVPGDAVFINWKGRSYTFLVDTVTIRESSDISIEYPSIKRKLTIYTCTPLWSADKRLVVIAYPREHYP